MENLEKKTIEVSRGFTYTYYTNPAKDNKPTILLCHGWPDTAALWTDVIQNYLVPAGYGVIAPDCLGFGETSKPKDAKAYGLNHMSNDLVEILDKEGHSKVVILGHDWGSALIQRLWNFQPNRVSGMVMVNVAYMLPSPQPFDLDAVIDITTKIYGYGTFWYWKLFTADDGPETLVSHLDSLFDIIHGEPETWLETLCKEDGVKNFLLEDRRQPVMPYATESRRQAFIDRMKRDKFDGPQNWYRSMTLGVQDEANKSVKAENVKITVPTLFFGGTRDYVCRPENQQPSIDAGLLPNLKTVTVDAGHWSMLSNPKEFGDALMTWLKENFDRRTHFR